MIGRLETASPVVIHLKEPIHVPHRKQYPLRAKSVRDEFPIIQGLKKTRIIETVLVHTTVPFLVLAMVPTNED